MAVAGAGGKGRLGPAGPRELSAAQSAGKTSPDEASIEQALAWWKRFDLSGQRERLVRQWADLCGGLPRVCRANGALRIGLPRRCVLRRTR